jgi:hypothetical protein
MAREDFKGYFLYRYNSMYVLLDTSRHIRIGEYLYESQARRAWSVYTSQGRQACGHDYTEQDEKTIKGYRSIHDQN